MGTLKKINQELNKPLPLLGISLVGLALCWVLIDNKEDLLLAHVLILAGFAIQMIKNQIAKRSQTKSSRKTWFD